MCKVSMNGCICRFVCCAVLVVFLCLFTFENALAAPIVDGPIAREKLKRDVQDLLYQQKFDELESFAKRLRTTKQRFPEGHWQLMYYYDALAEPPRGPVVETIPKWKWDRHFAYLEKWRKAYPRSVTAQVVTAKVWMHYGWEARGGEFASDVTEEGWQFLKERTNQAIAQLQAIPPNPVDDCPERFNTLLTLGKTEGWPREKYMALFKAAVAFEPRYYSFYASTTDYLTSRWHGEGNDWLNFLEKADAISGESEGRELYARMAPGWWGQEWTNFDELKVSWSKVKKGYRDMEKKFPDSLFNLNNFAKYACMAGDIEVARDLLRKIGNAPYLKAWQEPFQLYDDCRKAAGVGGPMRADLKESQEKIQARILAAQGDKYSQFWVAMEYPQGRPRKGSDTDKGMELLKASADQGFAPAQAALGMRYWNSRQDKTEKELALKLMELAALQDDDVKFLLPHLYEEGPDQNLVKAYAWYSYNDNENDSDDFERLSKILSPEQLEKAKIEEERIRKVVRTMP